MSLLYPKLLNMFYFGGPKHTNPNCPIELRPSLNPSSGIQSYEYSNPLCTKPAYYNFPFFLNKLGPRSSEWSINAHEARPGHHIQVTNPWTVTSLCWVDGSWNDFSPIINWGDPLVSFMDEGKREGKQVGGRGKECFWFHFEGLHVSKGWLENYVSWIFAALLYKLPRQPNNSV